MNQETIKEKQIDIFANIPKSTKGFKEEVNISIFNGKKLCVLTGLNGSGKSRILKFLSDKFASSHKGSVIFKTTFSEPLISNENRRDSVRMMDRYDNDDSVDGVLSLALDELARLNRRGEYNFYDDDIPNSPQYILELIADNRTNKDIREAIIEAISQILFRKYNCDKESFKKEINKPKIRKSPEKIAEYINSKINPFYKANLFIKKLSKVIFDDFTSNKREKKIYQIINELLMEKEHDSFRFILTKPIPTLSYYDLRFVYKENSKNQLSISFDNLSTGEKVLFEMICYKYLIQYGKEKIKCFILDEFDANLNPTLASLYLKTLMDLSKKCEFICVSTHSPSTVAEVEPENLFEVDLNSSKIIHAGNNEGKTAILQKLAPKFIFSGNLGYLEFVKSKKDVIIFVEGKTDDKCFDGYIEKNKLSYQVIPCDGAGNMFAVSQTFKVIPYFQTLCKNKNIFFIFDCDKQGRSSLMKSTKDENAILFISDKEPYYHKKDNLHFTTLIPADDADWKDYKLEELKKEDRNHNSLATKRLFDFIQNKINPPSV